MTYSVIFLDEQKAAMEICTIRGVELRVAAIRFENAFRNLTKVNIKFSIKVEADENAELRKLVDYMANVAEEMKFDSAAPFLRDDLEVADRFDPWLPPRLSIQPQKSPRRRA